MDTQVIIVLAALIVIILVALGAWYYVRRSNSQRDSQRVKLVTRTVKS